MSALKALWESKLQDIEDRYLSDRATDTETQIALNRVFPFPIMAKEAMDMLRNLKRHGGSK